MRTETDYAQLYCQEAKQLLETLRILAKKMCAQIISLHGRKWWAIREVQLKLRKSGATSYCDIKLTEKAEEEERKRKENRGLGRKEDTEMKWGTKGQGVDNKGERPD